MSSRIDKPGTVKFRPGPPAAKGRPSQQNGVPIVPPSKPQQQRQAPQDQQQLQQRRPSIPSSSGIASTASSSASSSAAATAREKAPKKTAAAGAPIATPSNRREATDDHDAPTTRSSGAQGMPIRRPSIASGTSDAIAPSPSLKAAPSPSLVPSLAGPSMGSSASKTKSYAFASPTTRRAGGGGEGSVGIPITIGSRAPSMGPPLRGPTPRAPSVGPSSSSVGRRSVTPSPRLPVETPAPAFLESSSSSARRQSESATTEADSAAPAEEEEQTSAASQQTQPKTRGRRGKEKETEGSAPEAETDGTQAALSQKRPRKAPVRKGKRASTSASAEEESSPAAADSTTTRKRKRATKKKEGEPKRPMNAFLLFKRDFAASDRDKAPDLTGLIAHQDQMKRASQAWSTMEAVEKDKYRASAEELKRTYDEAMKAFRVSQGLVVEASAEEEEEEGSEEDGDEGETSEGGTTSSSKKVRGAAKKKRRKSKTMTTISEDEAEYEADVQKYGPDLRGHRIDVNSVTMEDISSSSFKRGRAGPRTFHMEKVYKENRDKRRKELRNERAREGSHIDAEPSVQKVEAQSQADQPASTSRGYIEGEEEEVSDQSDSEAAARRDTRSLRGSRGGGEDDEEEVVEEENDEEGDGAASDAESTGALSNASASTHHTLRENRFAVQTRIVNGKIVIDDASLHVSLGQDPSMDGVGAEYVDENEREKFVNSASLGKRQRREKWNEEETSQFFKAVSMWGSDFEMISRMFKMRTRASIRKKWRFEEQKNPRLLDAAFARRLPVDLSEYGALTGVDLSGEAPRIEVRKIDPEDASMHEDQKKVRRKKESVGPGGEEEEEVVEEGEEQQGGDEEIVEEEGGRSPARAIRKKSTTPNRSLGNTRADSQGATMEEERAAGPRRQRSHSASMSTTATTSAAAAGTGGRDKEKQERQQREKLRREKEIARRRPVATDDDDVEIVDE